MAENWRAAFARRIAGIPLLGRAPVHIEGPINMPERLRYSDFSMGATTTVVMFPGDPDMVGPWSPDLPRPAARDRQAPGFRVPAPTVIQTMSNRRRDELAGLTEVPEARLDIFEGIA